jgi:phosphate-selective porin
VISLMTSFRSSYLALFALPVLLHVKAAEAQAPQPAEPPPGASPAAAPITDAPPPPPEAPVEPIVAPPPLAGWHGGLFYLRDENDDFRLYLQGRAQVDFYSYFGPGVPDSKLKGTIFLRRVRPELSGEFLGRWQWALAGDFVGATAPVDNAGGTAGADAQTAGIRAQATDVFLNYRADRVFNLQVGQYDAPFTMENRTSDKYLPFMERSLAVRDLGIPSNKELGAMLWGETENRCVFYSVGVFDGEGQNRPNFDDQAEVMGRVFTHPIGSGPLKDVQLGGSFRYTGKNSHFVYYNYPNMSTQGNYTFWSSSNLPTRIIPSGIQEAFAGELRIPIELFDFTGEFVYVKNGTREAIDGLESKYTERKGDLKGYSYYAQIGVWPLGHRDINGQPGYENPSHIDFKKKDPEVPARALQLLAKWEQLNVTYSSASRSGSPNPATDGDIKVNAFSLGANYWATKHVRLTLNYVLNMFPDSAPCPASPPGCVKLSTTQRAVAPGNKLDPGVNDDARNTAHMSHELLARMAVAF